MSLTEGMAPEMSRLEAASIEAVMDLEAIEKAVNKMMLKYPYLSHKVAANSEGYLISLYQKYKPNRILGLQRTLPLHTSFSLLKYSMAYMFETLKEEQEYLPIRDKVYSHFAGQEADDMYYMFKKRDIEYKLKQQREEVWQRSNLLQKKL